MDESPSNRYAQQWATHLKNKLRLKFRQAFYNQGKAQLTEFTESKTQPNENTPRRDARDHSMRETGNLFVFQKAKGRKGTWDIK